MSVQCNTYVMIGAVFPYTAFKGKYEELEPYTDSAFKGIHHHNGICVLFDGMGGNYVAIGKVLAKTENFEGFYEPVFPEGDLSVSELEEFGNVLEHANEHVTDFVIKPLVISHYR
jgi:hypothetical protein